MDFLEVYRAWGVYKIHIENLGTRFMDDIIPEIYSKWSYLGD